MTHSFLLSAKRLLGFFRREIQQVGAQPWHKVGVRAMWMLGQYRQHGQVLNDTVCGPVSKALSDDYFRVLSRPTLPYLSTAFSWEVWRALHADHCAFLAGRFDAELYDRILSDGVLLWRGEDRAAGTTIHLQGPCPHREGGLTLVLKLDGLPIYRVAFSLVRFDRFENVDASMSGGIGVYVGQVQGYPNCFDQIKEATRRCRDIAPPDVLVSALLGLAAALGVKAIKAVSLEYCPSYLKMTSLGHCFSYEQFWQGRWGASFDGRHYHLELPLAEKPLSEVKANHRGRTQAKRRFKHEVADTVCTQLQALLPRVGAVRPVLQPYALQDEGARASEVRPAGAKAAEPTSEPREAPAVTARAFGPRIGSRLLQTMVL